ncbi:hypothetical protein WMY93_008916 [Mugilogobius chulae]|uniref:RRM domain-containing protein n=1 Tax=Mugilogobius chulae TaxID=88201 RepID=A0AAW0PGG9_9GOBI
MSSVKPELSHTCSYSGDSFLRSGSVNKVVFSSLHVHILLYHRHTALELATLRSNSIIPSAPEREKQLVVQTQEETQTVSCVQASYSEVIHKMDSSSMPMPMSDPSAWATAMNNLGMSPLGLGSQTLVPDFEPNVGLMPEFGPMNPLMPGLGLVPDVPVIKEIIHCKSCTLFPPNPNLPPPATRERPPGCKTVFVGGLPENSTEQTIEEIFGPCGAIIAIRKSKKNFCHIRFAEEFTVDKALFLSGYRIRLGPAQTRRTAGVSMWTSLKPEMTFTSGNVTSAC